MKADATERLTFNFSGWGQPGHTSIINESYPDLIACFNEEVRAKRA
jgi:hypothetical protein